MTCMQTIQVITDTGENSLKIGKADNMRKRAVINILTRRSKKGLKSGKGQLLQNTINLGTMNS